MVWYSHLFQNFPQLTVIHTVKGFGIVNKAEIDVFLELSCFFDDPADVGNLISGSPAFSKTSLNIWKFTVHILLKPGLIQLNSVQSFSCLRLFVTPWTAARQASLSITNSQSLFKLMSIESVMPSNHLMLCRLLLLLPSIFPNIKVFFSESVLCIRWPKCWSFSFSISPFNEYSGLIYFRMDWFDLLAVHL